MTDQMKIDKMSANELRRALRESRAVVEDLMESHDQLMAGVGNIVVDYALLNDCRIAGDGYLRRYR